MKEISKIGNCILVFALLCIGIVSCTNSKNEHEYVNHEMKLDSVVYVCPMFCDSLLYSDTGKCTVCGMDLVIKYSIEEAANRLSLESIIQPTNQVILANAKSITPVRKNTKNSISVKGYIAYNPNATRSISSLFDGRIEKMYVTYNFQEVKKGQKLMDIYSPELVTAQQEFIFLLNGEQREEEMIRRAGQKLVLLGMSTNQLERIRKTKKVEYTVSIYAQINGHIHEMNSIEELNGMLLDKNGMSDNRTEELSIREGKYIEKGETILSIVSLSEVWAILKLYPEQVVNVKVGQEIDIESEIAPDNHLYAKISFIEPVVGKDSKFTTARVYLDKCDHHIFKIGSLINGEITSSKIEGLWIPISSIIDLGNGNTIVFLKKEQNYKVHKISVGKFIGNEVQVLAGLSVKDSLAQIASYMIDSESFIQLKD